MKVSDVLMSVAVEMQLPKRTLIDLQGQSSANEQVQQLLVCYNNVENQLALDYLPLVLEEKQYSTDGVIYFYKFKESIVTIRAVRDANGAELEYKMYADCLKTQAGEVFVEYSYTPPSKKIVDNCAVAAGVSSRLLVHGILAEYLASCGDFEAAAVWEKKYKDSIAKFYKQSKSTKIDSRRWV